jgi:hypothetical protein
LIAESLVSFYPKTCFQAQSFIIMSQVHNFSLKENHKPLIVVKSELNQIITAMNNKLTIAGAGNHMINVSEDDELHYWAKRFGITPEKLKSAVRAVGSSVAAISKYLTKK